MKKIYKKPFTMIENKLIQNEKLTIYQKMICIVLCSHANKSNTCFPSYATIAREVCCSKRKVIDTIAELEKLGIIKIHKDKAQNGKHKSNSYQILLVDNFVENHMDNFADCEQGALGYECPAPKRSELNALPSASPSPELYKYNNINSFNNNQSIIKHRRAANDHPSINDILENAELENFYNVDERLLYKTALEKMYNAKHITIDDEKIAQDTVRQQMKKIDYEIMADVYESVRGKNIANPIGYIMMVIYNAISFSYLEWCR